jgi:tetratricopeptide (TPR) repeat protein
MLASGQDDGAASELATVLERDPFHLQARLGLAELELKRNRIEHAFLQFDACTELAPQAPEGWLGLAEVRTRAGQPEEAEAALSQAVDLVPERDGVRRTRAELRARIGRFHGALVDAEASLRRDPRDLAAWMVFCSATWRIRGPAAGAEAVRKAVAAAGADPALLARKCEAAAKAPATAGPPSLPLTPGQAQNWPGDLGVTIREFSSETRQRNWATATQMARSARKRYPGTLLGAWLEGVAAQSEGALLRAEGPLLEALSQCPRSHRVVSNLVGLWSKQRGPEYAGDQLTALVERDPGFTYPLPIAAHAYVEAARPSKAEATIRRLLVRPEAPLAYRAVAEFFLRLDRPGEAIATCMEGLARFPGDPALYVLQGRGALLLGDREAAIRAYEAAVAARPDHAVAAAQLARLLASVRTDASSRARALSLVRELEHDRPSDPEVLAAMGVVALTAARDPRRARIWLEAARDQMPEDPGVRYQLALACSRDGEPERARQELREALRSGRTFDEEPEARRLSRELGLDQEPAAQSPR